jgi:hypothetical protein
MSLGNGNPKSGDKGSNFNYELKALQGLESIAKKLETGIVKKIIPGSGVTVSPASGTGNVTVSASATPQVGYRGFKYNISISYDAGSVPPGNIYLNNVSDPEGGYNWGGLLINLTDANGVALGGILPYLNAQPLTITNSAGVNEVVNINGSTTFVAAGANSYYFAGSSPPSASVVGVSYVDFGTSQKVPPYYGYLLTGSLNGSSLTTGTYYLSPGSTTASTDPTLRTITVPVSGGNIEAGVTISGNSSTMSIQLMINGVAASPFYAQPLSAGLPSGTYLVCSSAAITNASTVTLRIVQGAGSSYQIHGFYYKIV